MIDIFFLLLPNVAKFPPKRILESGYQKEKTFKNPKILRKKHKKGVFTLGKKTWRAQIEFKRGYPFEVYSL